MGKLSDRTVRTARAGRHGDGDGLQLVVSPTGRRKWVLRYQLNGVRRDMGLGAYPAIGLADARAAAADARKLLARGDDPLDARKANWRASRRIPTFGEIAEVVIADAQTKSPSLKTRAHWARNLGPIYSGPLRSRPINEITALDVAAVLKPVWREKPEVARRLYPAIRRVFEFARVKLRDDHGVALDNPARWTDLKALGFEAPRRLSKGNFPSLAYRELPAFMAALRARDVVSARVLEFLILTNVRTDAALKACWDQIDWEEAVWIVPLSALKDRMHRTEGFRIPLSDRAVEILRSMKELRTSNFIFPAHRSDRQLSNMAMLTLLKRMNAGPTPRWIDPLSKRPITVHGFRATFRTWAEEATPFPHATIEQAMGHSIGSQVERAYRRTDLLAKRRELMTDWAKFCESEPKTVILRPWEIGLVPMSDRGMRSPAKPPARTPRKQPTYKTAPAGTSEAQAVYATALASARGVYGVAQDGSAVYTAPGGSVMPGGSAICEAAPGSQAASIAPNRPKRGGQIKVWRMELGPLIQEMLPKWRGTRAELAQALHKRFCKQYHIGSPRIIENFISEIANGRSGIGRKTQKSHNKS
jgi:integrase